MRPDAERAVRVRMTVDVMPGTELDDAAVEPLAFVDVVGEPDQVRRRVVQGDEHRFDREDRPDPLADELDDRGEVELLRPARSRSR